MKTLKKLAGVLGTFLCGAIIAMAAASNVEIATGIGGARFKLQTFLNGGLHTPAVTLVTSDGNAVGPSNPIPVKGAGPVDGDDPESFAQIGCQALATAKTAVTATKMVGCVGERDGRSITVPYALSGDYLYGLITTAMTGTTSTAVAGMGAQGGSLRNYVTSCTVSNSHATVGTDVDLQDGSGGSTIAIIPAAAVYGGGHVVFPVPVRTTANTALYAKNVTTGASTRLSCTGYKAL